MADAGQRGGKRVPTSNGATILGAGAILLWSTLATLTVGTGTIPPFQTTAVAFSVGGAMVALAAVLRGRAGLMRPTWASLALGVYGLFGYHALYFAALKLAPNDCAARSDLAVSLSSRRCSSIVASSNCETSWAKTLAVAKPSASPVKVRIIIVATVGPP